MDLISALPDALIHQVFSFLPLEDIVRTSVLSERWVSTWTTTTHLVFDNDTNSSDFPFVIDSVVRRCISPKVKKFHINSLEYVEANCDNLNRWLEFAAKRGVEDLHLWLTPMSPSEYVLPPFLCCLRELVCLEVRWCCFLLETTIGWLSLKFLSIEESNFTDEILERIFKGSPVLESLEVRECRGLRNIVIDSTNVKRLVLRSSDVERIWAPHLQSLVISEDLCLSHFQSGGLPGHPSSSEDVSFLMEVDLDFHIPFIELLEKLCGVPTITIGNWCLQIMSVLEMEGVSSPLSNCRNLILRASISRYGLPGIAYMLQSSPYLENLVIQSTGIRELMVDRESGERFNFDGDNFLCSRKGSFQCLARNLKRVEITGSEAESFCSEFLLALIKCLLEDAVTLEKMMIKADLCTQHGQEHVEAAVHSKLLLVKRNVIDYQRASKNAEVINIKKSSIVFIGVGIPTSRGDNKRRGIKGIKLHRSLKKQKKTQAINSRADLGAAPKIVDPIRSSSMVNRPTKASRTCIQTYGPEKM
ncbi:hypothetical protein BT93_L3392 [Corymbia citriodora subsp. variegata]|uniref:F-box domain-containing protein n=1 Tax=Corymbia citriodora subsp. variegata TaxID=360336 RepID=A0A8T0CHE4_CORYI|nr:hypothetical protein BT93_L3392 [Corymbia citriodora subsp. variegata]